MVHVLRLMTACAQIREGATPQTYRLARKAVMHGAGRV